MESLLGWLSDASTGSLYALIFLASLIEGVVPIMPGDLAAALLAFYAARSGLSLIHISEPTRPY